MRPGVCQALALSATQGGCGTLPVGEASCVIPEVELASIPKAFRSLIPQVGRHIQPSIVHDWCYESKTNLTRAEADLLFLDGMKAVGVSRIKRWAMYRAVRAFGWTLWD